MRGKILIPLSVCLLAAVSKTCSAADTPCSSPGASIPMNVPSELTDAACGVFHDESDDIQKLIPKLLQPRVHTLDRKVYLFNYAQYRYANAGQPVALDQSIDDNGKSLPTSTYYFKARASDYFEKRDVGGGLYTATDPIASIDYSGNPGQLLRVGVPAGTKYLDIGENRNFVISPEDGTRLDCYLRVQCSKSQCHGVEEAIHDALQPNELIPDGHGNYVQKPGAFLFDPGMFVEASPDAAALLRKTYGALGVEFTIDSYRRSSFAQGQSYLAAI
jgi:hypothetical protein